MLRSLFVIVLIMMVLVQVPSSVFAKNAVDRRHENTAGDLQFSALFGVRSNSADTNVTKASVQNQTSWMAGVLGVLPLKYSLAARGGFIYNQRYVDISPTVQGTVSIQYSYFDVPLTVGYQFSDLAMIFAGPVLAFNQSKDVSCTHSTTCAALDVKSMIIPWQLGVHFLFLPDMGAEISYEYVPGDLSQSVANMRTLAIGAFYTF